MLQQKGFRNIKGGVSGSNRKVTSQEEPFQNDPNRDGPHGDNQRNGCLKEPGRFDLESWISGFVLPCLQFNFWKYFTGAIFQFDPVSQRLFLSN